MQKKSGSFFGTRLAPLAMLLTSAVLGGSACGDLAPESGEAHRTTDLTHRSADNIFHMIANADFTGTECYVAGNATYMTLRKPIPADSRLTPGTLRVSSDEDGSSLIIDGFVESGGGYRFLNVLTYESGTDSTLSMSRGLHTSIGTRGGSINIEGNATIDQVVADAEQAAREFLEAC